MSPHEEQNQGAGGLGGLGKTPKHWLMGDEAFEAKMPHHEGIRELWFEKWEFPVSLHLCHRFSF